MRNNSFFTALLTALLLSSCCPECEKCPENPATPNLDHKDLSCDVLSAVNVIAKREAIPYVTNLWNDQVAHKVLWNPGMATFFSTKVSQYAVTETSALDYTGIVFFPCIEISEDGDSTLYVSYKYDKVCPGSPQGYVQINSNDVFYRSSVKEVGFRKSGFSSADKFLAGLKPHSIGEAERQTWPYDKVFTDNNHYRLAFLHAPGYVDFGFGFIQDLHWKKFLHQGDDMSKPIIDGFWVVMGHKDNSHEDMRMIIFPADDQGKILTSLDSKCIEKSWPPIDPQLLVP